MADACEELGRRFKLMGPMASTHRRSCIKASGLELFLEIIAMFEKDEIMVKPAFRALLYLVPAEGACEHLLEMGGREVVDRAMIAHKEEVRGRGFRQALTIYAPSLLTSNAH